MSYRGFPRAIAPLLLASASFTALAQGALETPRSATAYSGIGLISGWHCSARRVEISIDGGAPMLAGSGTPRQDTAGVCGRSDTGFSMAMNWNLLSTPNDSHRILAMADGVVFADTTFQTTSSGVEYLTGKRAAVSVPNFPTFGAITHLKWDEAQQNFRINWYETSYAGSTVPRRETYDGALLTGSTAGACGPYPIGTGPKLQKKYGSFIVDYANGQIALSARYADGGSCNLPPVPMLSADAVYAQGFVGGDYNAAATAACPEFPAGLQLRVNGQTMLARTLDLCTSGNVRASASYNNQ